MILSTLDRNETGFPVRSLLTYSARREELS